MADAQGGDTWAVGAKADVLCTVRADADVLLQWVREDFLDELIRLMPFLPPEVNPATVLADASSVRTPCSWQTKCSLSLVLYKGLGFSEVVGGLRKISVQWPLFFAPPHKQPMSITTSVHPKYQKDQVAQSLCKCSHSFEIYLEVLGTAAGGRGAPYVGLPKLCS